MFNSLNYGVTSLITGLANYATPLLHATLTTLFIAATALIIGLIMAFMFALLESLRFKPIAWLASLCVITIRGLPEILVVIGIFNGIPLLLIMLSDGITLPLAPLASPMTIQFNITHFDVSPIWCGIIALALLYAAYASQTLRGAFNAVPQGQRQAALTLGLSKFRTLIRIIIPQMWRHALPGLSNQWLVLLKDTALVSLISVNDIMMQTKNIITNTKQPFTWYLIAAAIYLIISIISQKIIQRIEQRTRYFDQPVQCYEHKANRS